MNNEENPVNETIEDYLDKLYNASDPHGGNKIFFATSILTFISKFLISEENKNVVKVIEEVLTTLFELLESRFVSKTHFYNIILAYAVSSLRADGLKNHEILKVVDDSLKVKVNY